MIKNLSNHPFCKKQLFTDFHRKVYYQILENMIRYIQKIDE